MRSLSGDPDRVHMRLVTYRFERGDEFGTRCLVLAYGYLTSLLARHLADSPSALSPTQTFGKLHLPLLFLLAFLLSLLFRWL